MDREARGGGSSSRSGKGWGVLIFKYLRAWRKPGSFCLEAGETFRCSGWSRLTSNTELQRRPSKEPLTPTLSPEYRGEGEQRSTGERREDEILVCVLRPPYSSRRMPNPSPLEPPPRSWPWRPLLPPVLAAIVCVIVGVGALAALGFAPREVLSAVWKKVIWRSDPDLRWIAWVNVLQYSTPIVLRGLAVTGAFGGSVWNMGAQGQYLAGAIAGNVVGAFVAWPAVVTIPILLIAAVIAGAVVAMIAAILEGWRKVPVVLSTLL